MNKLDTTGNDIMDRHLAVIQKLSDLQHELLALAIESRRPQVERAARENPELFHGDGTAYPSWRSISLDGNGGYERLGYFVFAESKGWCVVDIRTERVDNPRRFQTAAEAKDYVDWELIAGLGPRQRRGNGTLDE